MILQNSSQDSSSINKLSDPLYFHFTSASANWLSSLETRLGILACMLLKEINIRRITELKFTIQLPIVRSIRYHRLICAISRPFENVLGSRYQAKTGEKAQFMRNT